MDAPPVPRGRTDNVPKAPISSVLLLNITLWHGKSLWLVQVTCLVVSPPSFSCTPVLFMGGQSVQRRLTLCRHCSAVPQMLLCYQLYRSCYGENYLHPRKAQYKHFKAVTAHWQMILTLAYLANEPVLSVCPLAVPCFPLLSYVTFSKQRQMPLISPCSDCETNCFCNEQM